MAEAAAGKVGRGSGRKKVAKLKINSVLAVRMKEHRGQKTWWISSSLQFLAIDAKGKEGDGDSKETQRGCFSSCKSSSL